MGIPEALKNISKPFAFFSREGRLVSKVDCCIHWASKSLIPECALTLADAYIDGYETSGVKGVRDDLLISRLGKIVGLAYKKYGGEIKK